MEKDGWAEFTMRTYIMILTVSKAMAESKEKGRHEVEEWQPRMHVYAAGLKLGKKGVVNVVMRRKDGREQAADALRQLGNLSTQSDGFELETVRLLHQVIEGIGESVGAKGASVSHEKLVSGARMALKQVDERLQQEKKAPLNP
jgi:hypothetical protein